MKLYQKIASLLNARENCRKSENTEWFNRHTDELESIADNELPHGSGIDSGCTINLDKSNSNKIVIEMEYHHMTEWGMYDGWSDHTITIKPDLFSGFCMSISGRNRNDIKEYLYQVFESVLNEEYYTTN